MNIDASSTITVDSLLNTYPSLKRVADKDRVRRFAGYYMTMVLIDYFY